MPSTMDLKEMRIKIKPLTFKLRNRVNQHGPWWNAEREGATLFKLWTLNGVHNRGTEPYRVWATLGKDFEIIESE